jgi:formylglycine-generating enzyme required for sulfatase activity
VVQVSYADAEAFARWAGGSLPSEARWEFAARGGLNDQVFAWGNTWNPHKANTWQGPFPSRNTAEDGYCGTAPVASFPANGYGLFDMTGNVWEWTRDWYSILCSPDYCSRYRPAAREAQSPDTGTSHIVFRLAQRPLHG